MSRIQTCLLRICTLGLILLLQGPALLTQEIAWVGMLVSYTRDRGLTRGVVETFDGEHPCGMCVKAAKLKQDEAGGNPAEKPREQTLNRLTWAPMVVPAWLRLKTPSGSEISAAKPAGPLAIIGRDREEPVSPPPRRVC